MSASPDHALVRTADRDLYDPDRAQIVQADAQNPEVDSLLSFFHTPDVASAFVLSEWTVRQEIAILTDMARSCPDPRVRLAAIETLRRRASEALRLSGHIRQVSVHQSSTDEEGNVRTADTQIRTLVYDSSERATRMLEAALHPRPLTTGAPDVSRTASPDPAAHAVIEATPEPQSESQPEPAAPSAAPTGEDKHEPGLPDDASPGLGLHRPPDPATDTGTGVCAAPPAGWQRPVAGS